MKNYELTNKELQEFFNFKKYVKPYNKSGKFIVKIYNKLYIPDNYQIFFKSHNDIINTLIKDKRFKPLFNKLDTAVSKKIENIFINDDINIEQKQKIVEETVNYLKKLYKILIMKMISRKIIKIQEL